MLIETERLHVGTGFLCSFQKKEYSQAVGVLVLEKNTPVQARKDSLQQLNGYFADINKAKTQLEIYESPIIFDLNADTNIPLAAQTAIDGDHKKVLFVCSDWKIYAQLCDELGVTRADHIILAQKGAMIKDNIIEADKGKKITSDVKRFIQCLKRGQVVAADIPAAKDALKTALGLIDKAKIFSIENTKYKLQPDNPGESWQYHLPYEVCVFETNELDGSRFSDGKNRINTIYMAYADPKTWSVSVMSFYAMTMDNNQYFLSSYMLTYDPVNPFETCKALELGLAPLGSDNKKISEYGTIVLGKLFPVIASLNNPSTTITKHVSGIDRIKNKKSAYAVHTIDIDAEPEGLKTEFRSKSDPKFSYTVGVHHRRAHKRRRPRTPPTAVKDVKVNATTVGSPEKGSVARVFRAVDPKPNA
jgi:hypothetical protein